MRNNLKYGGYVLLVLSAFLFAVSGIAGAQQCQSTSNSGSGENPADWWPGDNTPFDIVKGTEGSLQNGAGYGQGIVGQAFSFDGNNQNLMEPNSQAWDFGSCDFSIILWAKSNAATQLAPLISHNEGPGDAKKWIFWVDWGGLTFHINSPTLGPINVVNYDPFTLTPGVWYHLGVTRKGSLYVLYVNGLPVASGTDSHAVPAANAPLMIGQTEAYAFNGSIDEVKIYQRALSPAEVRSFGFIQGATAATF